MKAKMFEELLESVREGGAILRGQRKPSRRFEIGSSGIRAIRERTSLSQSEFVNLMGVSVKTLQNWEQDRRHPDQRPDEEDPHGPGEREKSQVVEPLL